MIKSFSDGREKNSCVLHLPLPSTFEIKSFLIFNKNKRNTLENSIRKVRPLRQWDKEAGRSYLGAGSVFLDVCADAVKARSWGEGS